MITLEDRLYEAGDDLRHTATLIPARPRPMARRTLGRAIGWTAAAAVVAALVALPLWLGYGNPPQDLPPVDSAPTGAGPDDPDPYWSDRADIIIEFGHSTTVQAAAALADEIRQWDGVADVLHLGSDQIYDDALRRFAVMGDAEAEAAALEYRSEYSSSIRVILAVGIEPGALIDRVLVLPGVARTTTAGSLFDSDRWRKAGLYGEAPGSHRTLASVEQAGFGTLSLVTHQETGHPGDPDALWYCLTLGSEPPSGGGMKCAAIEAMLEFGLIAGSSCLPEVKSLFAFFGLGETVSSVDIELIDGSTTRLTPVNGAILFAWEGPHGLASMTLNDDASPEMVSRVQAELSIYVLAEEPCRANRGDG